MPLRGLKKVTGFSLIELMVAIAIIGILATIALPSYQAYVEKSRLRAAQADIVALSLAIENHYQRTLSYPTHDDILENDTPKTEISTAFTSWKPSSVDGISFKLKSGTAGIKDVNGADLPGGTGYLITATPSGNISGCALVLDSNNGRKMGTGSCKYGNDWL